MTTGTTVAPPQQPLYRMFMGAPGRVYLLLSAMFFIGYIDRVNLSAAAPLLKAELGLSNTQLGLALAAFGYTYAGFQIVNGYLGDRFGPRLTLTLCGVLWAVGTLLTGFASGLTALIIARLLVGLGEAGTVPTGARVMTNWVPKARRGFAQGFTHSSRAPWHEHRSSSRCRSDSALRMARRFHRAWRNKPHLGDYLGALFSQ